MSRAFAMAVCIVLLAGAVEHDPEGDAAQRVFGAPVDAPAVDIVLVEGELDGSLRLRIEVAGALPIDVPDEPDRRFTYLFIVAQGQGSGSLHGVASTTVNCHFHAGQRDLRCEVTHGNATLRGIGQADRNVTVAMEVPWDGPFRVGGAAHESLPNGTSRDIVAQDFTQNALPYEAPPTDAPVARPTPWYKTPWVVLVLIAVIGVGAWAWTSRR